MELESKRLHIKPVSYKYTDSIMQLLNHPKVHEYNDYGKHVTRIEMRALIQWDLEQSYKKQGARFVLIHKYSENLIGTIGMYGYCKASNQVFVGFELDPAYWGQGLMHEAMSHILRSAKYLLQVPNGDVLKVIANVQVNNHKSIKLLLRLNFIQHSNNQYIRILR